MNAPFKITAPDPLESIGATFRAFSPERQLALLEHLAEQTDYVDEICEGLRSAALAYGRGHSSLDDEGDEAEAIADSIMPTFTTQAQWESHRTVRDAGLRYALTPRDAFGRAA